MAYQSSYTLACFLLLLLSLSYAVNISSCEISALFDDWLVKYGKSYNGLDEKQQRFEVFKDNVRLVEEHNSANRTYKLGLNRFADVTSKEYWSMFSSRRILEAKQRRLSSQSTINVVLLDDAPDSIDWREKGAVVPVKNEEQCVSSWAFSAVAAVEGINQIVTGNLISLSEQELVDCSKPEGNNGCEGGHMEAGFEYIIRHGGIDTESHYPYKAEDGDCQLREKAVSISGFTTIPSGDEEALKKAVANQPVSVSIDGSTMDFQLYESGIYSGDCSTTELDRGMVVVGYGTENGVDYWILKNSLGSGWGESGYIRFQRNINKCGIATMASFPVKTQ